MGDSDISGLYFGAGVTAGVGSVVPLVIPTSLVGAGVTASAGTVTIAAQATTVNVTGASIAGAAGSITPVCCD
jgi:hypothetical protein